MPEQEKPPRGPFESNKARKAEARPIPPLLSPEKRSEYGRKGAAELWRKIRAGEPLGSPKKKKRGRKITFKGMGKRGGKSRAATLTPERRKEIARQGGLARKRKFDQQRAAEREGQQGAA